MNIDPRTHDSGSAQFREIVFVADELGAVDCVLSDSVAFWESLEEQLAEKPDFVVRRKCVARLQSCEIVIALMAIVALFGCLTVAIAGTGFLLNHAGDFRNHLPTNGNLLPEKSTN